MYNILLGSILLSLLHAMIPNHWLPVLAIGKKENWSLGEVTKVTFLSGLAHALSTIGIGLVLGLLSIQLADKLEYFTKLLAPLCLLVLGTVFIYRHHRHKHFHLHEVPKSSFSKTKIILALVIAMFLSPCMEIEAYFLLAGTKGIWAVLIISGLYLIISVSGMVLWVRIAYKGVVKLNWHSLEHNAGMITGWTLVITGILSSFIS